MNVGGVSAAWVAGKLQTLPKDNSYGLESDNGPVRSDNADCLLNKTTPTPLIPLCQNKGQACLSCCAKFEAGPAEVRRIEMLWLPQSRHEMRLASQKRESAVKVVT